MSIFLESRENERDMEALEVSNRYSSFPLATESPFSVVPGFFLGKYL